MKGNLPDVRSVDQGKCPLLCPLYFITNRYQPNHTVNHFINSVSQTVQYYIEDVGYFATQNQSIENARTVLFQSQQTAGDYHDTRPE